MLVYIYIFGICVCGHQRDDLVRGVITRSLLTDFACNRRRIILRADGTFSLDNQTRPGGLVC